MARWEITSINPLTNVSTKFDCPKCGKKKVFRRFWDNKTGDWLQGDFGRCDRVNGCGFDESPYSVQFYQRHALAGRALTAGQSLTAPRTLTAAPTAAAVQIQTAANEPPHDFAATFAGWWDNYPDNTLRAWLRGLYGEAATTTCDDYLLTGTPNGTGWVCYWYTDGHGIVTDGRLIKYQGDGHRVKDKDEATGAKKYAADWVRAWIERGEQRRGVPVSVPARTPKHLYGLHLLKEGARVLIVEAEKTAVILETCYRAGQRPRKYDCILATGGGDYLAGAFQRDADLLAAASSVTLSPDNDQQGREWVEVAARLQELTGITINWDLETTGDHLPEKCDLADIVLQERTKSEQREYAPERTETAKIEANACRAVQDTTEAAKASNIEAAGQTPTDGEPLADVLQRFGFPADYRPRGNWYEAQFLF